MDLLQEGGTILVVDDDRDFLQLTKVVLAQHGYQVDVRTKAPSWGDLLRVDPAVVLMDVELEGENGVDVCRAIKTNDQWSRLPVILISGHGEERLKKEILLCKADGYLTKPISRALLLQLAAHYAHESQRSGVAGGQFREGNS